VIRDYLSSTSARLEQIKARAFEGVKHRAIESTSGDITAIMILKRLFQTGISLCLRTSAGQVHGKFVPDAVVKPFTVAKKLVYGLLQVATFV
jgi:hypothetical protein